MKESKRKYYGLTTYQAKEVDRLMPAVKRALKKNAIYAKVDRVAKSGMSRHISLYIVHKNRIVCLNWAFGEIFGDSLNDNREVRINGCGMDMLFEANYRLFKFCCPKTPYQDYCRYRSL